MYRNRFTCSSVLAAGILLCAVSTTDARLAGNTLAPDKLAANSAAASTLAAGNLAVEQLGPNKYVVDPAAAGALLATEDGREVLSFIVGCALPEAVTGLASEWLDHPLREAGRGWVSACLFARVNDHGVPQAFSMRGQNKALATTPQEVATFTLEEGAFYGDYFVTPGGPASCVACRGEDQSSGEFGGLMSRDCAEPALVGGASFDHAPNERALPLRRRLRRVPQQKSEPPGSVIRRSIRLGFVFFRHRNARSGRGSSILGPSRRSFFSKCALFPSDSRPSGKKRRRSAVSPCARPHRYFFLAVAATARRFKSSTRGFSASSRGSARSSSHAMTTVFQLPAFASVTASLNLAT